MLTEAGWFKAMSTEAVRAAVANAVEQAVRNEIHRQIAHMAMDADQSRAVEQRLYEIMFPEALEVAMQELMNEGMAAPVRVRVMKAQRRGLLDERYVVGVKAAEARRAGLTAPGN